jgi:sarcosine oxidase
LFHADAGTVLADAAMRALEVDATTADAALSMPERCTAIEVGADEADGDHRPAHPARRSGRDRGRSVVRRAPGDGGIDAPLAPAIAQVTFLEAPELVDRPGFVDWLRDDRVGVYGHPVPGIGYKVAFDAASTEPWLPDVEAWPPTSPSRTG